MADLIGAAREFLASDVTRVSANSVGDIADQLWRAALLTVLLSSAAFVLISIALPRQAAARDGSPLPVSGASAVPPWSGPSGFPPPRPFGSTMRSVARGLHVVRSVTVPWRDGGDQIARRASLPQRLTRSASKGLVVAGSKHTAAPVEERDASGSADLVSSVQGYGAAPAEGHAQRLLRRHAQARLARRRGAASRRSAHWVVMPGDTLWDIAAAHLATHEPARIARYWPRIHRLNRGVIGSDPSLIRPGQVLELPREKH